MTVLLAPICNESDDMLCSAGTTTQFNEYKNVSINNVKYEVIIK